MKRSRKNRQFEYDVCLSFAGEDRAYVRRVATALRERGVRVFYDEYAEAELWGKDLYVHLDQLYREAARYCVLFVSKHYARKLWTNHERESAQARALRAHKEYILPVRFDRTRLPGLRDTVGFIKLTGKKPEELATLICKKLGDRQRSDYFPPEPDLLFVALRARSKMARAIALDHAISFRQVLGRMTETERELVFTILQAACPSELPENLHVNIDLLRRCTGVAPARIKKVLGGLASLGFTCALRKDDETQGSLGKREMLVLTWSNFSVGARTERRETALAVACAMVCLVQEHYCGTCGPAALRRLDFGYLATATSEKDHHFPSA